MNKIYSIRLTFSCPYIAQRNGGNRIVQYGLTLDEAVKNLLVLYNRWIDHPYALTWNEAVSYTENVNSWDGAFKSGEKAYLEYDSRRYSIEEDEEE